MRRKITASRHFTAKIPTPGAARVGRRDERRNEADRLCVLDDVDQERLDDADALLAKHVTQDSYDEALRDPALADPDPSSTPMWASRVNVVSLATDHAIAWQRRSTWSWLAPSNSRRAAGPGRPVRRRAPSSGVIARVAMQTSRDMRCQHSRVGVTFVPLLCIRRSIFGTHSPEESGLRSMPDRRPRPRPRPRAPDYVPIMRTRSRYLGQLEERWGRARRPAGHIGMKPTVADHIAAFLVDRGVEIVFGLCGHTNISVLAALHRAGRWIRDLPSRTGGGPCCRWICTRLRRAGRGPAPRRPGPDQRRDRGRNRVVRLHPPPSDRRRRPDLLRGQGPIRSSICVATPTSCPCTSHS